MAMVVCRLAGLEPVCFNASDTRNKASLRDQVSQITVSHNISEYYGANGSCRSSGLGPAPVKNVLIMDEVPFFNFYYYYLFIYFSVIFSLKVTHTRTHFCDSFSFPSGGWNVCW